MSNGSQWMIKSVSPFTARAACVVSAFLGLTWQGLASEPPITPDDAVGIPLRPGMHWQVEELSPEHRIAWDWAGEKVTPSPRQPSLPSDAGRLVEENRIGRDFRDRTFYPGEEDDPQRSIFNDRILLFQRQSDQVFVVNDLDPELTGLLDHRTLEGFEWISERWLVGRTEIDGVACYIFRAPWPVPPPGRELQDLPQERDRVVVAAVGIDDGFPRRLEQPRRFLRFVPRKTISPAPELPARARAAIEEDQKRSTRIRERYRISQ